MAKLQTNGPDFYWFERGSRTNDKPCSRWIPLAAYPPKTPTMIEHAMHSPRQAGGITLALPPWEPTVDVADPVQAPSMTAFCSAYLVIVKLGGGCVDVVYIYPTTVKRDGGGLRKTTRMGRIPSLRWRRVFPSVLCLNAVSYVCFAGKKTFDRSLPKPLLAKINYCNEPTNQCLCHISAGDSSANVEDGRRARRHVHNRSPADHLAERGGA